VDYGTRRTFRGVLHDSEPDPGNPALSVLTGRAYDAAEVFGGFKAWLDGLGEGRPVFISDNPAFDFQWINHGFWHALGENRSAIPGGGSATTTPGSPGTSAGPRTGSGSGSRRTTTIR